MKFSLFVTCLVIALGLVIAALYFQYLIIPLKLFYYFAGPVLFMLLIASPKILACKLAIKSAFKLKKLSAINYFLLLLAVQLLFYYLTIWLFTSYIYQTNINQYLPAIAIDSFLQSINQAPLLYLFLPGIASASCGITLLYFVDYYQRSPFLTECFYRQPNKLPWLFVHNVLITAESYAGIIVKYIIFIALVLMLYNALSLIAIDYLVLQNPFFVLFISLPVLILFRRVNKTIVSWLLRNRYSLGFILSIYAVALVVILFLVTLFFLVNIQSFSKIFQVDYSGFNKSFAPLLTSRWEVLLLAWFFINMPKLANFIGRISSGFKVREVLLLNLLATVMVAGIMHFILANYWQNLYNTFTDPFWLFYSALPIILILWLSANYVKDLRSLWVGPLFVATTVHLKNRSIIKFTQRSCLILLVLTAGTSFIGWRLSQYLVTFITIFLFPVYFGFVGKIITYFIQNKIRFGVSSKTLPPAAGRMNILLKMSLLKK